MKKEDNIINEEKFIPHYQNIANALDETIPFEWENIIMYAEYFAGVGSFLFYVKPKNEDKWLKSGYISDTFPPDFFNITMTILQEFQDEFVKQNLEPWKGMIFTLDDNFKFNIEYHYKLLGYDNYMSDTRADYWFYKKFNILTQGSFNKRQLKAFMEEIGDNETFD